VDGTTSAVFVLSNYSKACCHNLWIHCDRFRITSKRRRSASATFAEGAAPANTFGSRKSVMHLADCPGDWGIPPDEPTLE
jgi:hypothetical protein